MKDEQKLIDLCFSLVLHATSSPVFCSKDNATKAEWVSKQLKDSGYETVPVGASWGVLKK